MNIDSYLYLASIIIHCLTLFFQYKEGRTLAPCWSHRCSAQELQPSVSFRNVHRRSVRELPLPVPFRNVCCRSASSSAVAGASKRFASLPLSSNIFFFSSSLFL